MRRAGPCGRCAVIVGEGELQPGLAGRPSAETMEEGYLLSCHMVVQVNLGVTIPGEEKIERRLPEAQWMKKIEAPHCHDPSGDQTIRKHFVVIDPRSRADNTFHDEWMSAMFLPHTHIDDFPSVVELLKDKSNL